MKTLILGKRFKNLTIQAKSCKNYEELLVQAAGAGDPYKTMEYVSSRTDLVKEMEEDRDQQKASTTALTFL